MKKKVYYVITTFAVLTFAYNLFFSSIKFNAQTPTYAFSKLLKKTIPEGWGFFTKSPREDLIEIYRVENKKIEKVELRNTSYTSFFGASRKNRKLSMEVSIMSELVNESEWLKKTDMAKLVIPNKIVKVDNKNLKYLKGGEFVLIKRQIVPWAWTDIVKPNQVPYEIAHITSY
jgi:antimicrobial peptide system SdpA family protein